MIMTYVRKFKSLLQLNANNTVKPEAAAHGSKIATEYLSINASSRIEYFYHDLF